MLPRVPELSPTEWAVLGLLSQRRQHGFALAKSLSADGDFGHVWTVPRPLVYRALDTLQAGGLIAFQDAEPGDGGPPRRTTAITARGRKALAKWLGEPVPHIRDARSFLLLKLVISDDLGRDSSALIQSQRKLVRDIERGLDLQVSQASLESKRTVLQFRLEMARGLQRFLTDREATASGRNPRRGPRGFRA